MGYAARVLADSVTTRGYETHRLTTIEVTFPRIVLAEFNTHRVFSRNSASSRAIPVDKRIAMIEADPFEPEAFGRNQKGMQAAEDLRSEDDVMARAEWTLARVDAVRHAKALALLGVHKQLANRLIEPFCWHTVVCTATEWENFFALRCNPDAQPEIRRAAELMRDAYEASTPERLDSGMWHMPLLPDALDLVNAGFTTEEMCRISVGRCARVSYLTHDGVRDPRADLELCDRLQRSGHMSPFEHVARPITQDDIEDRGLPSYRPFVGNFCGWIQLRKLLPHEDNFRRALESRR
jgi:thymidylate synthase ThyX